MASDFFALKTKEATNDIYTYLVQWFQPDDQSTFSWNHHPKGSVEHEQCLSDLPSEWPEFCVEN